MVHVYLLLGPLKLLLDPLLLAVQHLFIPFMVVLLTLTLASDFCTYMYFKTGL